MKNTPEGSNKICVLLNGAPLYRENIYVRMSNDLNCDFYVGSPVPKDGIKQMNLSLLKNMKGYLKNHLFTKKDLCFQTNLWDKILSKNYKLYVMVGDVRYFSNYLAWLYLKLHPRKRLILWGHGYYGKERGLRYLITRYMMWVSSVYMVYGEYARNLLIGKGIAPHKVCVIYNSLDYDTQIEVRKMLKQTDVYKSHFENDNKNLIFIGRLTQVKRLDMILFSMKMLKKDGINLNLTLVGDGVMCDSLVSMAKELNLFENIWFYGSCHDETTISELLYNADLCVSPGNVGLTAMHSLMYGCPVITHDDFKWQMPEFEAIREGVTGTYFERDNTISLTTNIANWITTKIDRDNTREECYKEIDSKWNPSIQIEIMRHLFEENLNS
ncbi:MAG: glycosyltransferase [Rikenellaceae bacterium]